MKKSFVSVIFDTAFFALAAFLLFLSVFINKIKPPLPYVISAVLSLLLSVLIFKFFSARKKKADAKRKQKENAELTMLQLALMKKSETTALFNTAFINGKKPFVKYGNIFCLPNENTAYYVCSGVEGAKKSDVLKLYNFLKPTEQGKIFCLAVPKDTEEFCAKFGGRISLISPEKTYAFLKDNGALPEIKFVPAKGKKKSFDFKVILNKKKAKNYMVFGLLFILMSFFAYYKIYYIIAGCGFLILFAVTLVLGKTENDNG